MRFFTIHLKDKAGNLVDYMTGEKTLTELVDKYDNVLMFLEKKGFTNIKATDLPKPIEKPLETTTPPICGIHNLPMTWKTGVSKTTNKPYAFWACSGKMPDGTWCNFRPNIK